MAKIARKVKKAKPNTISVIILTKNEAHDIGDCLRSVDWADEVIVFDCGSNDGTQDICRKHRVKLFETDWPGFGPQRIRALKVAHSDWILELDADERITPKLQKEIKKIIAENNQFFAYRIPQITFVLGKQLKHYKYGTPKHMNLIRLFKKGYVSHQASDIVHEAFIAHGPVGQISNPMLHYHLHDIEEILAKINSYSSLEAKKRLHKEKCMTTPKAFYIFLKKFITFYFFKKGFLDGKEGFIIAMADAHKYFYRALKIMYLQDNCKL
jgi:glycosyltransferase involved in cell wall biosynthesis